jgi:two-component system, response regulator YesN
MLYKLLIVDDEQIERRALKYVVEMYYENVQVVGLAKNGKEAIEKAKQEVPDILFIDIKMPGINGLEAAKKIKEFLPKCKVVFISAFNYFNYAKEAIEIGAIDFILKPIANSQVKEVLDKTITIINSENKDSGYEQGMSEQLRTALHYIEQDLLLSLVNGSVQRSKFEEYLRMFNKTFSPGYSIVGQVRNKNNPNITPEESTMITKILNKYLKGSSIVISKGGFYLLLMSENDLKLSKEELRGQLEHIQEELKKGIGLNFTIGIGEFTEIEEVSLAFTRAKIASYYLSEQAVIDFYDPFIDKTLQENEFPYDKEEQLCQIIKLNKPEMIPCIDKIFDWVVNSSSNMDEIRGKTYAILLNVIRKALDTNHPNFMDYYYMIESQESIQGIRDKLIYTLETFVNNVHSENLSTTELLLEKVCSYIDDHYMLEIKLEDMAEYVNYSSHYLSKVFKQYKKQSFIDYVTSIRLQKAKELLANPEFTIKEVSYLVGYSDQNYFTRVFKKEESTTPSEYRNKMMLISKTK